MATAIRQTRVLGAAIEAYRRAQAWLAEPRRAAAAGMTLAAIAAGLCASRDALVAAVIAAGGTPFLVCAATRGPGGLIAVCGDASCTGFWRVTYFDRNRVPTGHTCYRSQLDAVIDFIRAADLDSIRTGADNECAPRHLAPAAPRQGREAVQPQGIRNAMR